MAVHKARGIQRTLYASEREDRKKALLLRSFINPPFREDRMSIPTFPERTPQIGDVLKRRCGTIAIVEAVHSGAILQARIMHLSDKATTVEDRVAIHIPAELIGVSWRIVA